MRNYGRKGVQKRKKRSLRKMASNRKNKESRMERKELLYTFLCGRDTKIKERMRQLWKKASQHALQTILLKGLLRLQAPVRLAKM